MDLALVVFNVGAGIGVFLAGVALVYLAWQMTPLIRDSRALAVDLRRLSRTTETELRPILTHVRELASNAEVLSEDVAVKLERLDGLMSSLQRNVESPGVTGVARRPGVGWVESSHTREDETDA